MPFLNLAIGSFGVDVIDSAAGLPFLWNHRIHLRSASSVARVALGVGDEEIYLPCLDLPTASAYSAPGLVAPVEGAGRVRFGQPTEPDDRGYSIVQGNLVADLQLDTTRQHLLELDIKTGRNSRFRAYAKFLPRRPNSTEHRFQTLEAELPEQFQAGSELESEVSFRVIPRLGSSRDLYSVGVIAIRTLLVCEQQPLADLHRDLMELAGEFRRDFHADELEPDEPALQTLPDYMLRLEDDLRRQRLGPSLAAYGVSHEDAIEFVPERLWWQIVEFVARLFPGAMPTSYCKDFDDFDVRAPAALFRVPLSELDGLIEQCRALLFGDAEADREILDIIEHMASEGGER